MKLEATLKIIRLSYVRAHRILGTKGLVAFFTPGNLIANRWLELGGIDPACAALKMLGCGSRSEVN